MCLFSNSSARQENFIDILHIETILNDRSCDLRHCVQLSGTQSSTNELSVTNLLVHPMQTETICVLTFFSIHDINYIRNFTRELKTTKRSNKIVVQIFRMTNFEFRELTYLPVVSCPVSLNIFQFTPLPEELLWINPGTILTCLKHWWIPKHRSGVNLCQCFFELAYRHCFWMNSTS